MNRILFDKHEIVDGVANIGGERAKHIVEVLHGEVGQLVKTGVIDGLIGTSKILSITASGQDEATEYSISLATNHTESSILPWVDVVLAPPRPRVMKRLLPQLATMGVGRIFLVGAQKVEKAFWGATLLKEQNYRPLLIDGLMQSGTSIMPVVETRRNFLRFINDELDTLFPNSVRVVAHPYQVPNAQCHTSCQGGRLLLAIGPEGGWSDGEVELLISKGFATYSLGKRILRTDTATIALLSKLNEENQ